MIKKTRENMNRKERTNRELARGLRQWVADYNFAISFGNKQVAGSIKRSIDYEIAVGSLDERMIYEVN